MNKNTGLIYKQEILRTGYCSVRIGLSHSERMHIIIHKAVAYTFLDNPNNYPEVNHLDGNKQNNSIDNLEWCSSSRNREHAYQDGLIDVAKLSGEHNHNAKLTNEEANEARLLYARGDWSIHALAHEYHISPICMQRILKGDAYKVA